MNSQYITEAVYIHSFNQYMNSFKLTRHRYWASIHATAAKGLNKPNLVHRHLGVV